MNIRKRTFATTRKTIGMNSTRKKLHRAVTSRNIANILKLLGRSVVDVGVTDPNGNTLVHLAFRDCDSEDSTQLRIIEILKILLGRGLNPNSQNVGGFTALHLAVINRQKRVVEFLLDRKANLRVRDAQGNTLLHYFVKSELEQLERFEVESDDTEIAKLESAHFLGWLASSGFELDCANDGGSSPLHLAVQYNLQHIVLVLLEHIRSIDLNAESNRMLLHRFLKAHTKLKKPCLRFGDFSLFTCNTRYTVDVVRGLLAKGVPVDVANEDGETVLHLGLKYKVGADVLELLADEFTAVHSTDGQGKTALDLVVDLWWKDSGVDSYVRVVRALLSKGADISRRNSSGLTPVQQAVARNNFDLLRLLKEHGADLLVRTARGENLLHLAHADERTVKFLVLNGVDVNGRDDEGISPLHAIVWQRCSPKAKSLLRFGANVDLLDNEGFSVLRKAICQRNLPMVRELLKYGVDMCDREILEHFATIDRDVRDCLLKHIVKMSVVGMPGVEDCERAAGEEIFGPFREECRRETATLRQFFVDDRTSLLDFLRMDPNRRCAYVKNERLEAILNDTAFWSRLPNYFVVLLGTYLQSVRRKFLLRPGERAWYSLTGIFLPHLCVDRILAHMSNVDLMLMIRRNGGQSKRKGQTDEVMDQRKKRPKLVYVF